MRRSWHLTIGNDRGSVFLSGLVLVTVLTVLGLALFDLSRIEGALVIQDTASTQALYQAEAALSSALVGINDPVRGPVLIQQIVGAAPGTSVSLTSDTITMANANYTRSVVSSDVPGGTAGDKYLTAGISPAAGGAPRVVRVTLAFLAAPFQYAAVANNGDLILRGDGAVPGSGPGGADLVNGDVVVQGNVFLGTPGSGTQSARVNCLPAISGCTDNRPTISLPTGSTFTVSLNGETASTAFASGDSIPTGYRPDMPQPDVNGYVSAMKTAAGITAGNPAGNMTGTFQGTPVYNLSAIFSTLGANSDGSLQAPSGCGCGGSPSGNCGLYCQLQPLGLKKNPSNRQQEVNSTAGDDYYFDGTKPGGEIISGKSGQRGAKRLIDFNPNNDPSTPAPVFLADGNLRFSTYDSYGFAINGRATMVATRDLILSDNMIYRDGNTNINPSTADLIGLVAGQDIWYGDPEFGTFYEGSGVMLAGRDFNFVFYDNSGNSKTPENAVTLNGTMLANRQIAVFRDFAHPTNSNGICSAGTTSCRPVAFDSVSNSWKFLTRDANGNVIFDTSLPAFADCGAGAGACSGGTRRIAHYQMTINYETRLRTSSSLVPPGLPTGAGSIFSRFYDWRECLNPSCS